MAIKYECDGCGKTEVVDPGKEALSIKVMKVTLAVSMGIIYLTPSPSSPI